MLDDTPRVVEALGATVVTAGISRSLNEPPGGLLSFGLIAFGTVLAGRVVAYGFVRARRRRGSCHRAVIVGAGSVGVELHRLMATHGEYGLASLGVIDDVPPPLGVRPLGLVDDLERLIDEQRISRVIVAFGPSGEQRLISTLRATVHRDVDVYVVPRFFELGFTPTGRDIETIWGIPVCRIRRAALRNVSWRAKRAFDVVVSAILLLLLAPLFGVIAAIVRASSPGPVLFSQCRVGQLGREIEILKFRTMAVNDDADTTWSVRGDVRLTTAGKWLRRLSLDEIPQLWNVLKGDMSLVGPRPERPHFVNSYSLQVSGYGDRHRVPGGLTGLAQVHGLRGDTSIVERARFDNFYIEHWSPWQDTKILLRTGAAVARDALNDLRTATVGSPRPDTPDTTESATPGPSAAPAVRPTVAGATHRQRHGGPETSPAPSTGTADL